jgi:hypothetical protein
MGAAESKNVAEAVADVTNSVSQSTQADSTQVDQISNNISLSGCQIFGNLDVNAVSTSLVTNQQILKASQNTNLKNNIQQQMLQSASSKVGAMGIGYATASNAVSTMVNDTNTIVNAMAASASQYALTDNNFTCDNSVIRGNVKINFTDNKKFLSSQTLDNQQVSDIVNDVTQKVSQKATATVEGLGGLLIAIALIITAIGYTLTKPFTTGPLKLVLLLIIIFIVGALMTTAYMKSLPPFFSKPSQCIAGSRMGLGDAECINMEHGVIEMEKPPLRYAYGLLPDDDSLSQGNMLQMAISMASGNSPGSPMTNNGGYNMRTKATLDGKIAGFDDLAKNIGIPNIPNPLYNPLEASLPTKYFSIDNSYIKTKGGGGCTPGIQQYSPNGATSSADCPMYTKNTDMIDANKDNEPMGLANLNIDAWNDYVNMANPKSQGGNDTAEARALFARFVLAYIMDPAGYVDMHIYIDENEPVITPDGAQGLARDFPGKVYKFKPTDIPRGTPGRVGIQSGGTIHGSVGVVNDTTYKFQSFMTKIGKWILLAFLVFVMLFIIFYNKKAPSK